MKQEPAKRFDPLPGRVGHVGGVESLTLDGHRYFFGFDYKSDLVVSPLIDDPDAMAAFASEHMRQNTGKHDEAYWAELVDWAVEYSDLVEKDADRDFTTEDLRLEGHLLYLLASATEWDCSFAAEPQAQEAFGRLGFDEGDIEDCVEHCLQVIRRDGWETRPDEWAVARFFVTSAIDRLPGNWRLLYATFVDSSRNVAG
jgi:hypothetical protein